MKNKFISFTTALLTLVAVQLSAQVGGISYTLSPVVEHTWWDDKAGLDDGILYGAKLGFGFGENLELRGTYMRSADLKTNFSSFGLPNFADSLYTPRNVKMVRYGGELKANLSRGALLPFLTLGSGVQSIELDTFAANKNIYVSAGLGLKLSLDDRYTLTLEGRNTMYNFNAARRLLTPGDQDALGVIDANTKSERLANWSVGASLEFYLGGRQKGKMSDLDLAYYKAFSEGLQGLTIPIEPTLARINFHESLPYRSTWMGGGFAGMDFGPYVGVRGFYLRSMQNGDVNLDFDELAMYGGELRMRTNLSRGITPVLIVGGGYLDVSNKYVPRDSVQAESQAFAHGGVRVNLPLSNRFNLFGGVRGILTSNTDPENLEGTDQIQTSWMYNVGLKLSFGKKARAPEAVFKSEMDAAMTEQQMANAAEQEKIRMEAEQLKTDYETKIVELEGQLNDAYAEKDIQKAANLMREKEEAEKVVAELAAREAANQQKEAEAAARAEAQKRQLSGVTVVPSGSRISMSPAEFENLIEEILENMGDGGQRISPAVEQQMMGNNMQTALQMQDIDRRLGEIEKMLTQMAERQQSNATMGQTTQEFSDEMIRRDMTEFSAKLLMEIQKINDKVDQNAQSIQSGGQGTPAGGEPQRIEDQIPPVDQYGSVTEGNLLGVRSGGDYLSGDSTNRAFLVYEGMSGFAGFNLGGQTTANIGLRWHYGIGNSKFEFMPETFFGFGSPASFGITGNVVLPVVIKKISPVTPYIGTGAGFMQIAKDGDDKLRLNYNFIFGTYLRVGKGRFYVDLTARNLFKYNQLIAGYRFSF